ncbi:MAG: Rieske (2Fe-2S) protein [Thermoleophilia bacterium]
MWTEAAKLDDIAPGGIKSVRLQGEEVALCNYDGSVYAVSRRCGHMNAPLEQGSLVGPVLTCPLHHVQFDVVTGQVLAYPIDHDFADDVLPPAMQRTFAVTERLMWKIRITDLKTWPVRVRGDAIEVDV